MGLSFNLNSKVAERKSGGWEGREPSNTILAEPCCAVGRENTATGSEDAQKPFQNMTRGQNNLRASSLCFDFKHVPHSWNGVTANLFPESCAEKMF